MPMNYLTARTIAACSRRAIRSITELKHIGTDIYRIRFRGRRDRRTRARDPRRRSSSQYGPTRSSPVVRVLQSVYGI